MCVSKVEKGSMTIREAFLLILIMSLFIRGIRR